MSSRSGQRSRSRSHDSRKSGRKDKDKPWMKRGRSRSSSSSSSSSRSRSSRRKNKRSYSRSKSPVRPVMSKDPKYVNSRVFVAGLASDKANASDLQKFFERHGRIVDTLVHHNGYGFVQFVNEEDARRAVEAETGSMFHGKSLKCNMAAEGKKGGGEDRERGGGQGHGGGGGGRGGGGGGPGPGPGFPPHEERFPRDHSPNRDLYGPPRPFGDPFMRGRDLPPPPRDFRELPPPIPRDFYPPPRNMRDPLDLPPPPRDPFFDDPYRRPPPPDLYYDRFREDPYRRDPYRMDPYRDPYRDRDPFGPSLYDPVAAPKKPVAVDCEIIVMSPELRRYADTVEKRLKNINLLTNVMVIREDQTIHEQVEDAARRSCLFAIVINSQNEVHRSLTVTILHGVTQEHRNMPMDDAVDLVARSFEKFLTAEKEKLAAQNKEKPAAGDGVKVEQKDQGSSGALPKNIAYLLNLLVDNRPLSVEELDKMISFLQDRKDRALGTIKRPQPPATEGLQQLQPQQQSLYQPPHSQPSYGQPQQETSNRQQQSHYEPQPSYHQQQPLSYPHQLQPSPASAPDPQSKILSMINGGSAAPTNNTLTLSTLTSHTTHLLSATAAARPPPPPPPPQQPALDSALGGPGRVAPLAAASSVAASSGAVAGGIITPATLINFDNPTVQKALDNLIQSGPNLLKNISATAGQGSWSGQGTALATSEPAGGYLGAGPPQRSPY